MISVVTIQGNLIFLDTIDKYAEKTYGTYRNYNRSFDSNQNLVGLFCFNNEYDSKQFQKYAEEYKKEKFK